MPRAHQRICHMRSDEACAPSHQDFQGLPFLRVQSSQQGSCSMAYDPATHVGCEKLGMRKTGQSPPELRGSGRPRPDRSSIARLRIASHRGASRRALWQPLTQPSHSVPAQLFRSKIVLGMFSQLIADNRKRLLVALAVSLALHGGFLALMLRRPTPRFVSPVFLMAGNGGAALQTIYLDQHGRDDVVATRTARAKPTRKPPVPEKEEHLQLPSPEQAQQQEV